MNGHKIRNFNTVTYLGLTLDAKLRWKGHVKKKKRIGYQIEENVLTPDTTLSIVNPKNLQYK